LEPVIELRRGWVDDLIALALQHEEAVQTAQPAARRRRLAAGVRLKLPAQSLLHHLAQ